MELLPGRWTLRSPIHPSLLHLKAAPASKSLLILILLAESTNSTRQMEQKLAGSCPDVGEMAVDDWEDEGLPVSTELFLSASGTPIQSHHCFSCRLAMSSVRSILVAQADPDTQVNLAL